MRFKALKTVLFAAALFAAATPAHASSILGSTIQGAFYFPSAGSLYGNFSYSVNPFVVGAGVESVLTVDGSVTTDVDFNAFSLVLTPTTTVNYSGSAFNGPQFTVLSGNPFAAIVNVVASGGQNVTAALVGGVLQINWQGQAFNPRDTVTVNFATSETAVPEPATLLLLGTGLAAAAVAVRRRRA